MIYLRTHWDEHSWLFPPRGNTFEWTLSYGAFVMEREYGTLLGDSWLVGTAPGLTRIWLGPRSVGKPKLDRVVEALDSAFQLDPLKTHLLACDVLEVGEELERRVVRPYLDCYHANKHTGHSRRRFLKQYNSFRSSLSSRDPFREAGLKVSEMGWRPPPTSSRRARLS